MRDDHRPYALKVLLGKVEAAWVHHFIKPQLESLGHHSMIMKPWNLKLYGRGISFGTSVHVITAPDRNVRLTTWAMNEHQGQIDSGDAALICPGVRIVRARFCYRRARSVSVSEDLTLYLCLYLRFCKCILFLENLIC